MLLSGLCILMPNLPLIPIMFISQVLNGLVLPVVLIFMIRLVNDRKIMKGHTNGLFLNMVNWFAILLLAGLSAVMFFIFIVGIH